MCVVVVILSSDHYVQQRYLENGLSTHCHFSMKLMLFIVQSSTTSQHLDSFRSIKLFTALPDVH